MSLHDSLSSTILLLPETLPEHGVGHITRMLGLRRELLDQPKVQEQDIILGLGTHDLNRPAVRALLTAYEVPTESVLLLDSRISHPAPVPPCDLVVLDRRTLDRSFVDTVLTRLCATHRPVLLGLDAVGSGAELCDYVIDGFPRLRGLRGNEQHTAFISSSTVNSPRKTSSSRKHQTEMLRVLITLGGAGDKQQESLLLRALYRSCRPPLEVHIYGRPLPDNASADARISALESASWRVRWCTRETADASDKITVYRHGFDPSLAQNLSEFDLVCTHFGVTAYEAAAAGCAVLLLNPSRYHQQLSRVAGFATLPRARMSHWRRVRTVGKLLGDLSAVRARTAAVLNPEGRTTVDVIHDLVQYRSTQTSNGQQEPVAANPSQCPVCSSGSASLLYRFPAKNYLRCHVCGMLFMQRTMSHGIQYNTDYFFREYTKQYGKSYLEDFHHIQSMGARRLHHIQALLHSSASPGATTAHRTSASHFTVLDVGCAYGPFMAAAQEAGARSFGIDVAEDAVRYVVDQLGFQAACVPVQELDSVQQFGQESFDVVTMWYVIEHFDRLDSVLKKVAGLVAPNGVFAFSTPNGGGISARSSQKRFLHNSPDDHYSVWEAKTSARILTRFGFQIERIVVTGHHPDRFPLVGAWADRAPFRWILHRLSTWFALGDTFEVYARKVEVEQGDRV